MNRRTNNALVQTFGVNNRNELTNATRSGTFTVAGLASQPRGGDDYGGYPPGVTNVAVSGTGLSSGNANVYADGSWARAGATLASGNNSYTATAEDTYGRTAQDSVSVNLPATVTFTYDANGNLTGDGRRVFEYDYENQLTNVSVASAWRESLKYDAFGRKRVLQQHKWTGSAWLLTNEVRYVYDGMLVVQERHFQPQVSTNIPINTISYTRGNDLSGSPQGAGGIGGLLARTDHSTLNLQPSTAHAYYHADGNGNITAMVNTNGAVVARYQYDPYGNLLGMAGPLAEANTYRFSSKEWHANAGLYYYGFRYYEPNLQRWLNRDPIGEAGGINLYCFVRNHPLVLIDPFGLTCAPGFWEGLIPFWGSGKQAIHDFEEGNWGWGIFNTAMAATDIIPGATLVKAGLKAGGKVGVRALWKTGSHNWPSTQAWYKRVHDLPDHMNTHHALVPQRYFEGTKAEALFNQPWNLKPLDPKVPRPADMSVEDWYRSWHNAVEGKANKLVNLNAGERWWHGTPDWAKAAEVSLVGDLVNAGFNPNSNGCPE